MVADKSAEDQVDGVEVDGILSDRLFFFVGEETKSKKVSITCRVPIVVSSFLSFSVRSALKVPL